MKRLIFLLLVPFIFGCEPYIDYIDPHLSGRVWKFFDYDIITETIPPELIYETDTICLGGLSYRFTPIDKRFIKNQTEWEFDDNSFSLYCDQFRTRFDVIYPPYTIDEIEINDYIYVYAINTAYPSRFMLLTPPVITDIYLINGNEIRGISAQILLKFKRE